MSQATAQREHAAADLQNARTKLERAERLFRDGIAAKQEVDDARAAVVAAESGLKSAQATGGIAGVQLGRATLRAPIAGVVAAILVPAGQPVDGNGTPVIEIADTARARPARAGRRRRAWARSAVGQRAELDVDGVGKVAGEVEAIAPLVDPATNTVVVRIRVPNDDGRLRGGMFARGALLGAPPSGRWPCRAPRSCPATAAPPTVVAVVDADGAVAHRTLQLGADAGDDGVEVARRARRRRARHRRRRLRAARRHQGRAWREMSRRPRWSRVTPRASRSRWRCSSSPACVAYRVAAARALSRARLSARRRRRQPCPTPPPSWCCAT